MDVQKACLCLIRVTQIDYALKKRVGENTQRTHTSCQFERLTSLFSGAGARYVEMLREKRELRLALCGFTMFLFGLAFVAGVLLLAVEGDAK